MKKILIFIVCMALVTLACGMGAGEQGENNQDVEPVELQFSDPAQPIEVAAGSEFTLVLDSNPSTGYHWEFIDEPDAGVAAFVSRDYKAEEPVAPGSGGADVWTFRAVAAGETHITLGYYPPSLEPEDPQQMVTFSVTVK